MRNSSLKGSGMTHVNEGSQFYLSPTRLSPSAINHACFYSPAANKASPHFGRYSFSVELRVQGWVGLMAGLRRWFTSPQTVAHPSTNRARRRVTSLIKTNSLRLSQAVTRLVQMLLLDARAQARTRTQRSNPKVWLRENRAIGHNDSKKLAITTMYFGPQRHQMLFPNVFNLGLKRTLSSKFGIRPPLKIPPHLKHDATLPGEYMAPLCLTVGNGTSFGPSCASSSSSACRCLLLPENWAVSRASRCSLQLHDTTTPVCLRHNTPSRHVNTGQTEPDGALHGVTQIQCLKMLIYQHETPEAKKDLINLTNTTHRMRGNIHIISHIGDGFLRVKWPNQQCQSTEGSSSPKDRLQSHQVHLTVLPHAIIHIQKWI